MDKTHDSEERYGSGRCSYWEFREAISMATSVDITEDLCD
jgi:hypothetical protein